MGRLQLAVRAQLQACPLQTQRGALSSVLPLHIPCMPQVSLYCCSACMLPPSRGDRRSWTARAADEVLLFLLSPQVVTASLRGSRLQQLLHFASCLAVSHFDCWRRRCSFPSRGTRWKLCRTLPRRHTCRFPCPFPPPTTTTPRPPNPISVVPCCLAVHNSRIGFRFILDKL